MTLIKVFDEYVQLTKYRIKNATICCTFGPVQLVISAASLGQHVFSLVQYHTVFSCGYDIAERYLGSDIAIYDFGLFYRLWGIKACIANYLDGGYMRFVWCVSHVMALMFMLLIVGFVRKPRPFLLWPIISMQSFYSIGLSVLTLSALPKLLPLFFGSISRDLILPIFIYCLGVVMNCFLTYILWHYYWFLGQLYKAGRKNRPSKSKSVNERTIEAVAVKYPLPPAPTVCAIDVQQTTSELSTGV